MRVAPGPRWSGAGLFVPATDRVTAGPRPRDSVADRSVAQTRAPPDHGRPGSGSATSPVLASVARPRAGAPAARGVPTEQVVPRARRAHLDVVAEHRLAPAPEPLQLGRRAWAPPSGGQPCAEHVGHLHRAHLAADRAAFDEGAADVARGSQQLGVGVTDVADLHAATADVTNERVTHEAVLHACLVDGFLHTPASTWARAQRHTARLPPDRADLAGARYCARGFGPGRGSHLAASRPTGPQPGHDRATTEPLARAAISDRYSLDPMLDLAILGLLEERGELHGYEIRRQLREGLGLLANVSFGSLYPALARLEAAGAVEATEAPLAADPPIDPVPPTGSLSGELAVLRARRRSARRAHGQRARKVYRITRTGRALFADLLAGSGPSDDQRSFGLRLAFARHLPAPARLALLERRRSQLAERLAEIRAAGGEGLDVYARSVVEHAADALEHDIGWLDRLLEAEEQSAGTSRLREDRRTGRPVATASQHLRTA